MFVSSITKTINFLFTTCIIDILYSNFDIVINFLFPFYCASNNTNKYIINVYPPFNNFSLFLLHSMFLLLCIIIIYYA